MNRNNIGAIKNSTIGRYRRTSSHITKLPEIWQKMIRMITEKDKDKYYITCYRKIK